MYSKPSLAADRFVLLTVVGLLAGALTFLQVARPSALDFQQKLTPQPKERPSSTLAKTPPVKAEAPKIKTATTTTFVNIRAGKSISTPVVLKIEPGMIVQLGTESDAKWQSVKYGGKTGYVFKEYLQF